jgi:nucleotide-binding universal stress UspA family protein
METRGSEIVVGFDGSPDSADAVDWAVGEALLRGAPLAVCHAWVPAYPEKNVPDPLREHAEQVLASGVRHAEATSAVGSVQALLACGPAARVLCERSAQAGMVVVGSRGVGGLPGLLLGSVGLQVAAHALAPATVVRGNWRPVRAHEPAPVVVGADGSAESRAALEFAIVEAALRDVPLVAVCAVCDSASVLGAARSVEAAFGAAVDHVQGAHPHVIVHRLMEPGAPRSALLTAAAQGQLLVVGARGRGGLPEMKLGSVSMALLHHATCPVTVVREVPAGSLPTGERS